MQQVRQVMGRVVCAMTMIAALLVVGGCGEEDAKPGCGVETRCAPSDLPAWQLEDIQPKSDRFGQTYALEAYRGKTLVVALFAGWCPYCQRQAKDLDALGAELRAEGVDLQLVAVNATSASSQKDQESLLYLKDADGMILTDDQGQPVSRCTYPVFQDTSATDAWGMMGGGKDDLFVYTPDGTLSARLTAQDGTDLQTEAGLKRVRDAILAAR